MSKKETGIEEVEIQSDELSSIDDTVFKIRYWNTTYTFERIAQLYRKEKFVIPDLQRAYVWTQDMASRLIDSILLGIPLPNFFIYKNEDEINDIIDGLQRIITISTFMNEENLPEKLEIAKTGEIYDIFCVAVVSLHISAEGVRYGDIIGDRATGPVRVYIRAAVGTGEIHHLGMVFARFGCKNYALRTVFLRNLV